MSTTGIMKLDDTVRSELPRDLYPYRLSGCALCRPTTSDRKNSVPGPALPGNYITYESMVSNKSFVFFVSRDLIGHP